jgi:hypothetical protein
VANGSSHEGPARGDRYREKYARKHRRTQAKLDKVPLSRELPAYREEMESNSEVTVGFGEKLKVGAKGIPSKALGAALVILAIGAVVVAIVKALG